MSAARAARARLMRRASGFELCAAEVLPGEIYALVRDDYRRSMLVIKRRRRVTLGDVSLQFESRSTVLYEVHELVRAGGTWTRACVERELAEIGRLVPMGGELTATFMLHGGDVERGRSLCERLTTAPSDTLALTIAGVRIGAEQLVPPPDPLCPVQYLRFPVSIERVGALIDPDSEVHVELLGPDPQIRSLLAETRLELGADLLTGIRTGSSEPGVAPTFGTGAS